MEEKDQEQPITEYLLQRQVYDILEGIGWKRHKDGKETVNSNVEEDELIAYLCKSRCNKPIAKKAASKLAMEARNLSQGLRKANIHMSDIILHGIKVRDDETDEDVTVRLIDFSSPLNNDFYFRPEVSVNRRDGSTRRIDIVCYINGIALVTIELKADDVQLDKAVRQGITDQTDDEIPHFFTTVAICMGGNNPEGIKLASVGTDAGHYYAWREDEFDAYPAEVDDVTKEIHARVERLSGSIIEKQLVSFLDRRRFIDYLESFIVVEKKKRKACRYNQFYAVKRANKRREMYFNGSCESPDGVVEHGPGSGKTITMEADANLFLKSDPTKEKDRQVILLVDRTDLQDQNFDNFSWLHPHIVESSAELLHALNEPTWDVIVVIINKFGHIADGCEGYTEIERAFDDFAGKVSRRQRLVLNDEAHRTQSGIFHDAMKRVLPADITCYSGYTGTADTADTDTSTLARYGKISHAYDSAQAERDGAIVPICYEAREISQDITSKEALDDYFSNVLYEVPEIVKERLKAEWATDDRLKGMDDWIKAIARDIQDEFTFNDPRLVAGEGNALLIVPSIDRAFDYWDVLRRVPGFEGKVFPITSYRPSIGDVRTARTSIDSEDATSRTYRLAREMFGDTDPDEFEREVKRKFIEHPEEMKVLIIVDKLNTGFDAPPISTIFIDREMKSHALVFQAINRGNRCDGRDVANKKDKCHVIDYSGNFESYQQAVSQYTLEAAMAIANGKDPKQALEDARHSDNGKNTVMDAREMYIRDYENALLNLQNLCSAIPSPQGQEQYNEYFCGSAGGYSALPDGEELIRRLPLRREFYKSVNALCRAWHEALPHYIDAYGKKKAKNAETVVRNWRKRKDSIALASGDRLDVEAYSELMEDMLYRFIETGHHAEPFLEIDEFSAATARELTEDQIEGLVDKLGTRDGSELFLPIAGKISQEIVHESNLNAAYGEKLSEKLQGILDKRASIKASAERMKIEKMQRENNRELIELGQQVLKRDYGSTGAYPGSIDSNLKIALYDNVAGKDEGLAGSMFDILKTCYSSAWLDPEVPLNDPSFKQAGKQLQKKTGLSNEQIREALKLARNNARELS